MHFINLVLFTHYRTIAIVMRACGDVVVCLCDVVRLRGCCVLVRDYVPMSCNHVICGVTSSFPQCTCDIAGGYSIWCTGDVLHRSGGLDCGIVVCVCVWWAM